MVTNGNLARFLAGRRWTFGFWTFLKCPFSIPKPQYKKGVFLDFMPFGILYKLKHLQNNISYNNKMSSVDTNPPAYKPTPAPYPKWFIEKRAKCNYI
jgi:hypothetical protein